MREAVLTSFRLSHQRYLQAVLLHSAPERHGEITALFERHMAELTDYCLSGYGGAGSLSVSFIRELHKRLFPAGYTHRHELNGKLFAVVPGEYRDGKGCTNSLLQPGAVVVFVAPGEVHAAMDAAVERLNTALPIASTPKAKRDAVLWFIFDVSVIHPFGDANGRVMCMLCDLLLIKEGLLPFHIDAIKDQDREGIYKAAELAQRNFDLTPLYEVIERYNPAALG